MKKSTLTKFLSIILSLSLLSGCLFNTPEKIATRFLTSIKSVNWKRMASFVDWNLSRKRMQFPNKSEQEIMIDFAENLTGVRIREYKKDRLTSMFIYLTVKDIEKLEKKDDQAKLRVTVDLGSERRSKEFTIELAKVEHRWRIVLTPNLFERMETKRY